MPSTRKRILFISNIYPPEAIGGYERRCAATADALAAKYEIAILTARAPQREPLPEREVQPNGITVFRLLPRLRQRFVRNIFALRDGHSAVTAFMNLFEEFAPDLIYVWNGGGIPAAMISEVTHASAPISFSIGDQWLSGHLAADPLAKCCDPPKRTGTRYSPLAWAIRSLNERSGIYRPLARRTANFCWNSRYTREATNCPVELTTDLDEVIYPASKHEREFSRVERSPVQPPEILFFGRVAKEKGLPVALKALVKMQAPGSANAQLVVCGRGPRRTLARLRLESLRLGIAGRVHFLGSLSATDLADRLSRSSVVVVPSTWEEPFGLVCVEAAMAGVPLVASRSGGIQEIFRDETEARYFTPGSSAECARALDEIISSYDESLNRAMHARTRAFEFSWARYMRDQERFVAESLTRGDFT